MRPALSKFRRVESAGGDARVVVPVLVGAQVLPPAALVAVIAEVLGPLGFREVDLYLVDHDRLCLVATPGSDAFDSDRAVLAIDDSPEGTCFRDQNSVEVSTAAWRVCTPVTESADRLGVLVATGTDATEPARVALHETAGLLGQLLATRDRYTDVFARTRRRNTMELQAEMQWNLLPPLTFSCESVAVAGLLEPAYHIGGDSFDYALNGDVLHFGIFDSMGHDLSASLLTSLAVAAYRNRRREGDDLVTTLDVIDQAITEQFTGKWVTLQLGELDTKSGRCRWVNAGHPLPLLVRDRRVVGELGCPPCFPAGLGAHATEVAEVELKPGDFLFFYTDGVIEARDPSGRQFGEERLQRLLMEQIATDALPAEILRTLLRAVIDHQYDNLRDDATALLVALPSIRSLE